MDRPYRWWSESTPVLIRLFRFEGSIARHSDLYWYGDVQQPAKEHYGGPVAILIDGGCFSACEDFVVPFKDNHRAVILGERTARRNSEVSRAGKKGVNEVLGSVLRLTEKLPHLHRPTPFLPSLHLEDCARRQDPLPAWHAGCCELIAGCATKEGAMKAVRLHRRGGPEELVYEEAPKPAPGAGDALVRVHACAITPTELSWGPTYTTHDGVERLPSIPGHEVSGVVEATVSPAAGPREGDAVYALTDFWRDGAAAEYVVVRAADLAPKPANLDDTQAAAVPLSALTAWQALFDHARLVKGQRVLIHGAAGGVGTYAVQLARWCGARVTGTARKDNADFLRGLGAEDVIDYTAVRFEDVLRDQDVVLDTVGGDTLERSWQVLRRGGVLVTIAGSTPAEVADRYGVRGVFFIVSPSREQLIEIGRLLESGRPLPIVDATFPLAKARPAFELGLKGHNRGKLVLQVAES